MKVIFFVFSFLPVGLTPPPRKRRKTSTSKKGKKKTARQGTGMAVKVAKTARSHIPVRLSSNCRNQVRRREIMAPDFTLCSSMGTTPQQLYGGHPGTSSTA